MEALDSFALSLIRRKADQLAGHYGFTLSDRDDISQELTLALLGAWPKFDPERGNSRAFQKTVVERKAASLVRRQKASKRQFAHRTLSLDALLEQEWSPDTDESAEEDQSAGPTIDPIQEVELTIDVETVLARLKPRDRELAELLKHYSLAEAARKLGVSRTTLQYHAQRIREAFIAADYGDEKDSDSAPWAKSA